jgi:hypothetical protein
MDYENENIKTTGCSFLVYLLFALILFFGVFAVSKIMSSLFD